MKSSILKPSNFTNYPWSSILENSESEIVAQNIMNILKRTGDEFRPLSFQEYKSERLKDGGFTNLEEKYFNSVIKYCGDAKSALLFCSGWANES